MFIGVFSLELRTALLKINQAEILMETIAVKKIIIENQAALIPMIKFLIALFK